MGLGDYLTLESIEHDMSARCKRDVLSQIASLAAKHTNVAAKDVEAALMAREKLGSTGVGHGVAIPHGKIEGLDRICALFVKLEQPLAFDALDDEPVDLVFVLLAPEEATAAHLKALAKVTRLLRDGNTRDALRGAETAEAMFAIVTETTRVDAA